MLYRTMLYVVFGVLTVFTLGKLALADRPAYYLGPKTIDILFVGNSLTYANCPPQMLQALADAAPVDKKLRVALSVAGSTSFQDHWETTGARKDIRSHNWRYVVLQERSFYPVNQHDRMMKYGKLLDREVKNVGAKTIFFQTWADRNAQDQQQIISAAYAELGKACRAYVAPVGSAEHLLLARKPTFPFYNTDGRHESPQGAYLVACVFFATIYQQSPVGLPARLTGRNRDGQPFVLVDLSTDDASLLQHIAWEVVEHLKSYKPLY